MGSNRILLISTPPFKILYQKIRKIAIRYVEILRKIVVLCGAWGEEREVRSAHSRRNHAKGVYIIRNLLRYIINGLPLYIIKPQENTRWRVMRYKGGFAALDDIHDYVVMICQACGLDKQKKNFW